MSHPLALSSLFYAVALPQLTVQQAVSYLHKHVTLSRFPVRDYFVSALSRSMVILFLNVHRRCLILHVGSL